MIKEAKDTVSAINQSVREIRTFCSEIIMSKELERLGKVINKLHQLRLSAEDENGQVSDLISKFKDKFPIINLQSPAVIIARFNSTHPLDLQYFDLDLLNKDYSEINRALSDLQNIKNKKLLIDSLSKESKSELLEHYQVLLNHTLPPLSKHQNQESFTKVS